MHSFTPGIKSRLVHQLMSRYTHKPVVLTNDENMQNVWVYDWGQADARLLFINFVKSMLASGKVDGLFADKWGTHCQQVTEMILQYFSSFLCLDSNAYVFGETRLCALAR